MPQNDISETLQNILHFDEKHGQYEESMDEERFIRVHIDVTQVEKTMHNPSKMFRNMHFTHNLCCYVFSVSECCSCKL